jgi:hypothetical protein
MTRIFIPVSLVLFFAGCALLPVSGMDDPASDPDDPVAQAALRLRQPASAESYESDSIPTDLATARAAREVVPGMPMDDVRSILGEPREVETAGNPMLGNQRWVYSEASRGSMNRLDGPSRVVYFENGRVAGWENSARSR